MAALLLFLLLAVLVTLSRKAEVSKEGWVEKADEYETTRMKL